MSLQMIFLKAKNEHSFPNHQDSNYARILTWLKFFYIWVKLFYTK